MQSEEEPITSPTPGSPAAADVAGKNAPKKQGRSGPDGADDAVRKIDRPGFDLSGSSGETHAGLGLGLGDDASDTAGDRRLFGRRPDNKLVRLRWAGPDRQDAAARVMSSEGSATPSPLVTKKER